MVHHLAVVVALCFHLQFFERIVFVLGHHHLGQHQLPSEGGHGQGVALSFSMAIRYQRPHCYCFLPRLLQGFSEDGHEQGVALSSSMAIRSQVPHCYRFLRLQQRFSEDEILQAVILSAWLAAPAL